ncbi:MAG: hypothetical protein ACWIPJ_09635 [Polaribacter sp.]
MKKIILFFSLFLMLSCSNDNDNDNDDSSFQSKEVAFTEIGKDQKFAHHQKNSGSYQKDNNGNGIYLVIDNLTDWNNLISRSNNSGNLAKINIDFSNFQVIVIIEYHTTGGWSIDVTSIIENKDNLTVNIDNLQIGGITQSPSRPSHIVKIPKSNLIINNQTDWQNLMNKMDSAGYKQSNTFSETAINFDKYSIIAIFLEIKGHGWEITINNITENKTNISVSIKNEEYITSVITQPFHIVKIPKTNQREIRLSFRNNLYN